MSTPSLSRPLLFFYILVIYVLLQFSWWAYLLIDLNKAVYGGPSVIMPQNDASTFEQKWKMVAGEGIVFLAILVFGIYKTRQAFQKEFALARQQRNFLLSITHEFKSPLAAIKLGLQTIQKRNLDGEQMSRVVTAAISETDRINMLLEDTLMAARIESKNFELSLEVVDFSINTRPRVCQFMWILFGITRTCYSRSRILVRAFRRLNDPLYSVSFIGLETKKRVEPPERVWDCIL